MIPYRNRARIANERLRKILSDIIADRKRLLARKTLDDSKQDLLTLMIAAAQEGHGGGSSYLTDGELVSNLAVFFVAGKKKRKQLMVIFG